MATVSQPDAHQQPKTTAATARGAGRPPWTLCVTQRLGHRELAWTVQGEPAQVLQEVPRIFTFLDQLAAPAGEQPPPPPAAGVFQAPPAGWYARHRRRLL